MNKDLNKIYAKAHDRYIRQPFSNRDAFKKSIFYGIKYINSMKRTEDFKAFLKCLNMIKVLKESLMVLTPNELLTMFPVEKTYDGKRYNEKDYFYTMNYLQEIGLNKIIGENVDQLLCNYVNANITRFCVVEQCTNSSLRCLTGHKVVIDEVFGRKGYKMYCDKENIIHVFSVETYTKVKWNLEIQNLKTHIKEKWLYSV